MNFANHFLGLALSLNVVWSSPGNAAKPVVAVFSLDRKGSGLHDAGLQRLTDFLGARLTEMAGYQIVPAEELRTLINKQKAASYKECYDDACQIEIGKELAAEKILTGSVKRFGDQCVVTLKLVDLAKATQERAGTGTGLCSPNQVLNSLLTALRSLSGNSAKVRTAESEGPRDISLYEGIEQDIRTANLQAKERMKQG